MQHVCFAILQSIIHSTKRATPNMILFSRQPGRVWRQLSTYDDGLKVIQAIKVDDFKGAEDLIQSGCRLDGRDVCMLVYVCSHF